MKKMKFKLFSALVLAFLLAASAVSFAADVPFPGSLVRVPMGTASAAGTFYLYSGGVAKVINDNVKNVEILLEVTGGSGANIALLQNKEVDLMICEAGMVWEKMNGIELEKDEPPFKNVRALTPAYVNIYACWAVDPKITKLQDLEGKKIGVSQYLSGAHLGTIKVFEALGINAEYVNTAWADSFIELADGRLQAVSGPTGHPSSPAIELESKMPTNYVSLSDEDIEKILKHIPYYSRGVIPKGTYKYLTEDYQSVENWVCLFVRDDMDEDLAYLLTKALMENNPTLVATHNTAKYSLPENIVKQPIPIHKGAAKYYREKGIEVPANLVAD
ncbi:C4-dicarboxylate ABC transporter substrate-binding protein [Synergistales bacterium]|nr:C4-dicarboxylate ABC transporter substrate-binding protein [Synergistales bacterium]